MKYGLYLNSGLMIHRSVCEKDDFHRWLNIFEIQCRFCQIHFATRGYQYGSTEGVMLGVCDGCCSAIGLDYATIGTNQLVFHIHAPVRANQ